MSTRQLGKQSWESETSQIPGISFPFVVSMGLCGVLGFPAARGGMNCPTHGAGRAVPNVDPPSTVLPGEAPGQCRWEELELAASELGDGGERVHSLWAARGGKKGGQDDAGSFFSTSSFLVRGLVTPPSASAGVNGARRGELEGWSRRGTGGVEQAVC